MCIYIYIYICICVYAILYTTAGLDSAGRSRLD